MINKIEFVAVCEIDLTQIELDNLATLSKELNKSLSETVRMCMNERCSELLQLFQHNVPKPEKDLDSVGEQLSFLDA